MNDERPAITEELIAEFIKQAATASGIPGLRLKIDNDEQRRLRCYARCDEHDAYGFGATLAEAVANLRLQMKTPEQVAAQKRAKATKLMEEAYALLGEKPPVQMTAPTPAPAAQIDDLPDTDAAKSTAI